MVISEDSFAQASLPQDADFYGFDKVMEEAEVVAAAAAVAVVVEELVQEGARNTSFPS